MWLPHLCLRRGPKEGRKYYVTSTFLGIPSKGEQNHKCYGTPTFSGIPNKGE